MPKRDGQTNPTKTTKDKFAPLRRGLLEFVVYKIIAKSEVYAADIVSALKGTELEIKEGTLYPLLSEMQRNRGVECRWVQAGAAPPRKYYRLTDGGREQLKELEIYWEHLGDFIDAL